MKNTTIKKILSLITLTLLATIVLAGCGKSSDQSVKKIQSKKPWSSAPRPITHPSSLRSSRTARSRSSATTS